MTVYVSSLFVDHLSDPDDVAEFSRYTEYSTTHRDALTPKFE